MNKYIKTTLLSAITALAITGCGGSSTASTDGTNTGTFVDSPVANLEYRTSSGITGTTNANGKFRYKNGDTVEFHIGKLSLGSGAPTSGGIITPQHITDDNTTMTLMLAFLQSLDSDNNTSNGITIPEDVVTSLEALTDDVTIDEFDNNESGLITLTATLEDHLDEDYDGHLDVNETEAHSHFEESLQDIEDHPEKYSGQNGQGHGNGQGQGNGNGNGQGGQHGNGNGGENGQHGDNGNGEFDINNYPVTENLSQDVKDALAYMGNEERLAYDVYTYLYNYHKDNSGEEIKQLTNIATRSESKHISIVQQLVQRYNLTATDLTDVSNPAGTITNMPSGVYDIQAIQDLYDALIAKGKTSKQTALEVGCMVEVTDVNDLNNKIEDANSSNATDVLAGFDILLKGSYNHYWAFDKGLKNLGVTTGCCSLGTVNGVNYCKTEAEYPKNSH